MEISGRCTDVSRREQAGSVELLEIIPSISALRSPGRSPNGDAKMRIEEKGAVPARP